MTCSYVRLVLNEKAKMSNVYQKGKIIIFSQPSYFGYPRCNQFAQQRRAYM